MNELKEQIMLNASCTMASYEIGSGRKMGTRIEMDLDDLMQLIETYTTKKELEARIDMTNRIFEGWIDTDTGEKWLYMTKKHRDQIITQLSTELTNKEMK